MKISLIVLTNLYFVLHLAYLECLNAIIKNSLMNTFSLNFTIFIEYPKGFILYCIDNRNNKFFIELKGDNQGNNTVLIHFNEKFKHDTLEKLCGCLQCNNTRFNFLAEFKETDVKIICNSRTQTILIHNQDSHGNEKYLAAVPKVLNDTYPFADSTYVILGNNGPYDTQGNTIVYPSRTQLTGCLDNFLFNTIMVHFNDTESHMKQNCSKKCTDNICNGGLCHENYANITCNCSITALNGRYCNDSLANYSRDAKNSYEMMGNNTELSLKISWELASINGYCLLEFVNKDKYITFILNKTMLVEVNNEINSSIPYNDTGVNFMTFQFNTNSFTYKVNNNLFELHFFWYPGSRINVGFSERKNKCEVFQGSYGLYINPPLLRNKTNSTRPLCLSTTTIRDKTTNTSSNVSPIKIVLILVCIASPMLFAVILVIFIRRNRKQKSEFKKTYLHCSSTINKAASDAERSMRYEIVENKIYEMVEDDNEDVVYDMTVDLEKEEVYGKVDY